MDDLFVEPSAEWFDTASPETHEDPAKHEILLSSIQNIDRNGSRIGRSSILKHEAGAQVSDFHSAGDEKVSVKELLESLGDRAQLAPLRRRLNKAQRQKTLAPPVEKHVAAHHQRVAGYDAVTRQVSRWQNLVKQRRSTQQLTFPLEKPPLKVDTAAERVSTFELSTPLEREIAALLGCSDSVVPAGQTMSRRERRALAAMSLDEALARRNELAKHRALLTYQEAKQRRKNRIKSRRYHRSLKREMTKQHLQEFERLKVCDPEAALNKLQQIEKQRLEERASQRHRNTGRWARLQSLKRNIDPEARAALAETLRIGKELRQKNSLDENKDDSVEERNSSEDEDATDSALQGPSDDTNPWISGGDGSNAGQPKDDDYVEIWGAQQAIKQLMRQSDNVEDNSEVPVESQASRVADLGLRKRAKLNKNSSSLTCVEEASVDGIQESQDDCDQLGESNGSTQKSTEKKNKVDKDGTKNMKAKTKAKSKGRKASKTDAVSLDELFDDYENQLNKHCEQKHDAIKESSSALKRSRPSKKAVVSDKSRLSPEELSADNLDMDVSEDHGEKIDVSSRREPPVSSGVAHRDLAAEMVHQATRDMTASESSCSHAEKLKKQTASVAARLDTKVPLVAAASRSSGDLDDSDEGDEGETDRRLTLAEAFADDNVLAEFQQEKKETSTAEQPQDVQQALPGWGDWGGPNLVMSARKRRRLLFKAPRAPRRDDALPHVILSERRTDAVRSHQVSELPHYFRSVAAFEASIRAPVGREWLPAQSHHKLVQPRCVTRSGTIIPPMDESLLMKKRSKHIDLK